MPQFAFTPHDFAARSEAEVHAMALSLHGLWTVACLQFLASVGADEAAVVRAIGTWSAVVRQVLLAPTGQEVFTAPQAFVLRVTRLTRRQLSVVIAPQIGATAMKEFLSTNDQAKLEGRAEGKAEGEVRGRARLLLRQLDRRFGPLPPDLEARLAAASIDDLLRRGPTWRWAQVAGNDNAPEIRNSSLGLRPRQDVHPPDRGGRLPAPPRCAP